MSVLLTTEFLIHSFHISHEPVTCQYLYRTRSFKEGFELIIVTLSGFLPQTDAPLQENLCTIQLTH